MSRFLPDQKGASPQQRVDDWFRGSPPPQGPQGQMPKPVLVAVDGALVWRGADVAVVVSQADPNWRMGATISIERAER
jgi:hypothetical protein